LPCSFDDPPPSKADRSRFASTASGHARITD
jgi:hypothetical protein